MANEGRWSRLARIGGLTTRVTSSVIGQKVASVLRPGEAAKAAADRNYVENAERIVDTVSRLKGAAMKVGQQLAVAASNMDLPPEVSQVLGKLHAEAEPVPFAIIREDIEASLERPLGALFAWFDEKPLGTASLGQAHLARLPDGREVVVKVLHRGIDTSVSTDLMALKAMFVAGRAFRRDPAELDDIFAELKDRLEEELDYLHEAANIRLFEQNWGDDADLALPRVHPSHSSDRVLVMDRVPGVPLDKFLETATPAARARAANTLIKLYYRSVFHHRALHADPHPGNYLFSADGRVGLLDFGCVKRFDEFWLAHYAQAALAGLDGDRPRCLDACREIGGITGNTPAAGEALWLLVELMAAPIRAPEHEFGGPDDHILDAVPGIVKEIMKYPEIRAPKDLILLHRTLAGLYTMTRKLGHRVALEPIVRSHSQHAIDVARRLAMGG
jgi:predicted unusual protein kinase regulating ubiquinone biosynthesis (AarF/ABC1/UbiB family)